MSWQRMHALQVHSVLSAVAGKRGWAHEVPVMMEEEEVAQAEFAPPLDEKLKVVEMRFSPPRRRVLRLVG